jgi:hypothetical protein
MPQLHLYVPDEVAETAKARAKAAGKSLSAYLADLVVNEVAGDWPEDFFQKVVGGWKGDPIGHQAASRRQREAGRFPSSRRDAGVSASIRKQQA